MRVWQLPGERLMGLHGQDLVPGKPALPGCPHLPGLAVGPASLRREPAGRCRGVCPCGRPLHWRAPAHVSTSAVFWCLEIQAVVFGWYLRMHVAPSQRDFCPKVVFLVTRCKLVRWGGLDRGSVTVQRYTGPVLQRCIHSLSVSDSW